MPPTVILIRHAQALHNATQDHDIHDPVLSTLGEEQCLALRDHLKEKLPAELRDNIGLILVSPMRRTIDTALRSMDWLLEKGVPIQAHAGWQENSDKPCDTGTPVAELQKAFPQVDFSHVDPVFPDKTSDAGALYKYNRTAILARAQSVLADLYARPEKVIAVVSHSAFMRQGVTGYWYFNADYRIFDVEKHDEAYGLKQWESTLKGGMGLSWEDEIEIGSYLPQETV